MIAAAAIRDEAGVVHSGPTHDACRAAMVAAGCPVPLEGEVGYVTCGGAFLSRRAAAEHALACGQVSRLGAPPYLYDDDLTVKETL